MKHQQDDRLNLIGVQDLLAILNYVETKIDPHEISVKEIRRQRNLAYKEVGQAKGITSPDTTLNNVCTRRIGLSKENLDGRSAIQEFDGLVLEWLTKDSNALMDQIISDTVGELLPRRSRPC